VIAEVRFPESRTDGRMLELCPGTRKEAAVTTRHNSIGPTASMDPRVHRDSLPCLSSPQRSRSRRRVFYGGSWKESGNRELGRLVRIPQVNLTG